MKIITTIAAITGTLWMCAFVALPKLPVKQTMRVVQQHLLAMDAANADTTLYPRSIKKDGSLNKVTSPDWTSGFYPGSLWLMYDYTGDKKWEQLARKWTAGLAKEQFNTGTHDLGFMLYCSFGNGYRLTNDTAYKSILIQGAKSLSTRFNAKAGVIKSWDHNRDKWTFPVIIDNMMNLELLYWASKTTGDTMYAHIANTHALTTIQNHFRPDNSSYHVVDYDPQTGAVRTRVTHQGYADESAWARGQAWGMYGYTVAYRETKDKRFLQQANKIAGFFIRHPRLPGDKVPYWDFDAPAIPNAPRDAAAAAIAASGLLELAQYAAPAQRREYKTVAGKMLASLASPAYLAKPGTNHHFSIMHATGHYPAGSEIDTPLNYADYYFIEALMRYKE